MSYFHTVPPKNINIADLSVQYVKGARYEGDGNEAFQPQTFGSDHHRYSNKLYHKFNLLGAQIIAVVLTRSLT